MLRNILWINLNQVPLVLLLWLFHSVQLIIQNTRFHHAKVSWLIGLDSIKLCLWVAVCFPMLYPCVTTTTNIYKVITLLGHPSICLSLCFKFNQKSDSVKQFRSSLIKDYKYTYIRLCITRITRILFHRHFLKRKVYRLKCINQKSKSFW